MLAQAIKRRLSKEESQKGFTLIELLAVIVILGIIAVIAFPMISNLITKTGKTADTATARQIYDASRLYVSSEKEGVFDSDTSTANNATVDKILITELQTKGYLDAELYLPSTKAKITGGEVKFTDGKLTGTDAVVINTGTTGANPQTYNFEASKVLKSSDK
ncbi:type II secretion system protein [Paenibacillus etheri]|uniref:Prepilin-type N-terminal cleavage/methylation domain-containing protein n=1 Tax=Paenibacillus etheri TaxID=1306852 RepID=A0A0W1ARA7_9BACL|nr:type II secretion system protein [Paenibacillus etheri]KTD83813.1 hypothetical protein UQ64_26935 [Paenibacillus etheri]